jgi:hypothetical protein
LPFLFSALRINAEMAKKKNPAAVQLGRRGAKARMKKLTPEQRIEVAKKAAAARWGAKPKKGA